MKAKRKTLNAGDVLAAMEEMEFERFMEPLREALEGQYLRDTPTFSHRFPSYFIIFIICVDMKNIGFSRLS